MQSKKFMVFAPNRMFLTYISEVLPELGVDDVMQSTFVDWAAKLVKPMLPKGWRITSPDKPLALFFDDEQEQREQEAASNRLRFKGSLACKQALEQYIHYIMDTRIPFKKLSFVFSRTKQVFAIEGSFIKKCFMELFSHLPYHRRVDALRKHLKQEMNKHFYAHLRELKIDLDKQGLAKYEKMLDQILDSYMVSFPRLEVFASYRELMTDPSLLRRLAPTEISDDVIEDTSSSSHDLFAQERIEVEDIAALLYLHHLVEGMDKSGQFDHTVIDEAQDLSALEIAVIALATKANSLTIVGDIAQGIHAYRGIHSWDELTQGVFLQPRASMYTLSQSYRSTVEIMRCANEILKQIDLPISVLAKPVLRYGERPEMLRQTSRNEMWERIASKVKQYTDEGFRSIAIVTKTIGGSKRAHKSLKAQIPSLTLLSSKDKQFPGGVTVMPAFLTKGLQFDVVILVDVEQYERNEWDAKLLYVALTRPVHRLVVTGNPDQPGPLWINMPQELYTTT